jgi:general secretion pathway protein D
MTGPEKNRTRRRLWLATLPLWLVNSCAPQPQTPPAPVPLLAGTIGAIPTVTEPPIPLNGQAPVHPRASSFYYGTGTSLGAGGFAASEASGAYPDATGTGITLNFSNANVQDVAKAVLGDLLKLNYEIDPTVQGTITLTTASPVDRDAVLPIFEQSLLLAGLALVQQDNLYRIVPAADAPRQAGTPIVASPGEPVSPGFGLEIVPLRYVSAAQMQNLLQPLVPSGSIISADSGRNIITIAGTTDQRAAILNDVALFDVNQMTGKSFALFRPQSVDAEDLAKGLQAIIAGPDGQGIGSLVQLIPLDKLNAVLAISAQPQYLAELQSWVTRLDQPSDTDDQQLYVYQVQNGKAADLASVLSNAFGTANTPTPAAADQGANAAPDNTAQLQPQGGSGLAGSMPAPVAATPDTSGPAAPDQTANAPAADNAPPDSSTDDESGPPPIRITPDNVNNALLIRCLPSEYAEIQQALKELDIPPLQVLIEASVAEVTLTNQLQYGIQYYFHGGSTKVIQTTSTSQSVAAALPGFAAIFTDGQSIPLILSALQSLTTVTVLSAPELMVLNNQTASLQVGDEVPIATEQSQSTLTSNAPVINSIQYQNTGVILKVTPRVNAGGLVTMDVSQEVSDVSTTTTSTLNSPTISERLISSSVAIHDGQTVALGGLISDSRNNGKSGIPVLQNIPVLGNLFSTTNNNLNRTELLVLLTPHVVGDQYQAQAVTDELREKLSATEAALANGQ